MRPSLCFHSLLPPKLVSLGWSSKILRQLLTLVAEWRSDFEEDGTFTKRQHRIMVRWFLDADLEFSAVTLLLASVDNLVMMPSK
jgi:hypothetical protein